MGSQRLARRRIAHKENSPVRLWKRLEATCLDAAEALDYPFRFQLLARPIGVREYEWVAMAGEQGVHIMSECTELRKAGESLIRLAKALPLTFDPVSKIDETIAAQVSQHDRTLRCHIASPSEKALVKLLLDPEAAAQFAQCRNFEGDNSEWANAARTRCIRPTDFNGFDVIEPGAVWFVEWLESKGAQTLFSCEGHPEGFHVVFSGTYELAHALASAENLIVSVFRTEVHLQPGLWKMELDYWPESRSERDSALRQLTVSLRNMDLP